MGNAPSSTVPLDAQLSAVNASLQCRYLDANVARAVYASTTAPNVGSGGQQIYFSDIVANFYLPIPATDVNLTLTFSISNASPSLYTIQSVTNGQDIAFQSPGSVLPPFGPVTLGNDPGDASTFVNLGIRSVQGTIDGNSITCGQTFDYIVASVCSYGSTASSKVLSPSRGIPGPPTALDTRYGAANISVYLNTDQFGGFPGQGVAYQIEGNGPTYLRQGQDFSFTNYKSFITIAGSIVNNITTKYSPDTYLVAISTTLLAGWIRNTNRSDNYDINKDAIGGVFPLRTGRYVDGPSSSSILFPLPNWDSLTLPNIRATGSVGSTVSFYFPGSGFTLFATSVKHGDSGGISTLMLPSGQQRLWTAPIVSADTVVIPA